MVSLSTMYEADRRVSVDSRTNDGGEITVPFLSWSPGRTTWPCEAPLPEPREGDGSSWSPCGLQPEDEVHSKLVSGDHHEYLANSIQPGMYLTLDDRLGYNIPLTISAGDADALIQFLADAIAIGAGYPSIRYTKRKMPFRG